MATVFLAALIAVSVHCGNPGESSPPAVSTAGDVADSGVHQQPTTGEGHGRQAILEQARQRGALFWGAGNEPGWNIEIGPATTKFITSYGEERHEFATPRPAVDRQSHRTTYQTRFEGHTIVVEITREPCRDTMSDEAFPARVRIELDGREFRGCGAALTEIGG